VVCGARYEGGVVNVINLVGFRVVSPGP
jgi:hypothetical protein